MKLYILHAYGIEGVQITENQKNNIDKILEDSNKKDSFLKINGYSIKVSSIATIEPKEENAKGYLIEQYNKEAEKGLHDFFKMKTPFELNAEQTFSLRLAYGDLSEEDIEKRRIFYENAPKREDFVNSMDYIKAKTAYYRGEKQ